MKYAPSPRGMLVIASSPETGTGRAFVARNPRHGDVVGPEFRDASADQVQRAASAAHSAFDEFRATSDNERASLLDRIAYEIEAIGEPLVDWAERETALPKSRLSGEVARTTAQLRMFGAVLRDGSWAGVRIDHADDDRMPLPRPDLRQRRIPLGPVAVFAASNFPFAFSVAGGDTTSALAVGSPVVVKAHEGHPGTSELVAAAVALAVRESGMPAGVFSLLQGAEHRVGIEIVTHPAIAAVGFTGSRPGGLALAEAARERAVPIPVFAEMSAVNPVFLLPGRLSAAPDELAAQFVASLTLGAGQLCTNPGIVLAVRGPELTRFADAAADALSSAPAAPMLSQRIAAAFDAGVSRASAHAGVDRLTETTEPAPGGSWAFPALLAVSASTLLASPELEEEVFGSSGLIVAADDEQQLLSVAERLSGQLTATMHAVEQDYPLARRLLPILERHAGRVVVNGWPTGVEVVPSMVHGGPYPATSDGRSTSVGTLAIDRFLRPVAYQNFPEALLPAVVRDGGGGRAHRMVDDLHAKAGVNA